MRKMSMFLLALVLCLGLFSCTTPTDSGEKTTEPEPTETPAVVDDVPTDLLPSLEVQEAVLAEFVPLDKMVIPKKRIVALGEASHGSRELVLLKKEVLQNLVENNDCRAFAVEADWSGCLVANDYVENGVGTPEAAANAIGYNVFKTQEAAEILEWMYTYNQTAQLEDKLRFYGFDPQTFNGNKEALFAYLEIVDPDKVEGYKEKLVTLDDDLGFNVEPESLVLGFEEADKILTDFIKQETAYVAASSQQDYDFTKAHLESIHQYATLRSRRLPYAQARNDIMAEKIQWISNYEERYYQNQVLFIAGHVSHIGRVSGTQAAATDTGEVLAQVLGPDYYAIGTEFNSGTFNAIDGDSMPRERAVFEVESAGNYRLNTIFVKGDLEAGFADLSKVRGTDSFFNEPQQMTYLGDVFTPDYLDNPEYFNVTLVPSEAYDALIMFKTITPFMPLQEYPFVFPKVD